MNHPMHPQHPLTLLPTAPYGYGKFWCNRCGKMGMRFVYRCFLCDFDLDPICATTYSVKNKRMEKEMTHFSHDHPLILKTEEPKIDDDSNQSVKIIECRGCSAPIVSPFYSCGECFYFLHKNCAELPKEMNHPMHPQHPLTLLSSPRYDSGEFGCDRCGKTGKRFVYNCSLCKFDLDLICAPASGYSVRNKGMEKEMTHFSHDHPLILKAKEPEIKNDIHSYQSVKIIKCQGCWTPISGPFYSCRECVYFLHKVCAELPKEINHPMHPQHPLTLFSSPPYASGMYECNMCRMVGRQFVYHCSECKFNFDMICALASHTIEDKCHQHPLIPLQLPISFLCHICRTEEKCVSYKCNICPFWVHQNCTVSLPSSVKHSCHHHNLTLLQFVSQKYSRKCDICYDQLFAFACVYCCEECKFCTHVNCARSEEAPQLPREENMQTDGQCLPLLLVPQKTTDSISWFAKNYRNRDASTNFRLRFDEFLIDRDNSIKKEIKFFGHEHSLFLIEDQVSEEICDACALTISTPSYGCIDCGYFLHKCCTELPKHILHPIHPQHQISYILGPIHPQHKISLWPCKRIFQCRCCWQWSNGFSYKCFQCERYLIDIKCDSLLWNVKHEAHPHPLIPRFVSSGTCTACGFLQFSDCILSCNTCRFTLCLPCAMAPSLMKHRYDKHPFILTYSPQKSYCDEYICELCEKGLNPKHWHYHCGLCDQFTHIRCMIERGADSNIKYGKSYNFKKVHEHKLTLVSCTNDCSLCNKCSSVMEKGYSVGLKCITCGFRIHLLCALHKPTDLPN